MAKKKKAKKRAAKKAKKKVAKKSTKPCTRRQDEPIAAQSFLLYIELASVSFKASLIPKDKNNRIWPSRAGKPRRHRNSLALSVYRGKSPTAADLVKVEDWFGKVVEAARHAAVRTDEVLVVATAVFRRLDFRATAYYKGLTDLVAKTFKTSIHILDGFIEAQLLVNSSRPNLAPNSCKAVFDLGGGSLELIYLEPDSTHYSCLPLGVGQITALVMSGKKLQSINGAIRKEMNRKCKHIARGEVWHGVGGAIRAFREVFDARENAPIWPDQLTDEYDRFTKRVFDDEGVLRKRIKRDVDERLSAEAPRNLGSHRKLVYSGGLIILKQMCEVFEIASFRIDGESDLRQGLMTLLDVLRPTPFT